MTPPNYYKYLILDNEQGDTIALFHKLDRYRRPKPYKSITECITFSNGSHVILKRWHEWGVPSYTPLAHWGHSGGTYGVGPIFKTFKEAKNYLTLYATPEADIIRIV